MEKIIGKGSYGYIFFPCLKYTENLELDTTNYVTKLQIFDDAKNELDIIDLINNIDKNYEFHLGKYIVVDLDEKIYKDIIYNYNLELFINYNLNELTPILIKYGGYDISFYLKKIFNNWSSSDKNKIFLFLKEYYRMLQGIKLFNDNNIIHHDIKPKNILYDIENNRLNFIDFGLTNTKENIIELSNKSDYEFSIFHSTFPFELYFFNFKKFNNLINKSESYFIKKCNMIIDFFTKNTNKNINKNINKNDTLIYSLDELFVYFYNINNKTNKNEIIIKLIKDFEKSILNFKKMNYDNFIEKSLNTIDSYSYGLTLIYILNHIEHIISDNNLYVKLMNLGIEMSSFDLDKRISIEESLYIFKNILNEFMP